MMHRAVAGSRLVPSAWIGTFLLVVALCGCRSNPVRTAGTHTAAGDTVYGHLPGAAATQAFTFEGVESSILDFTIASDEGAQTAPTPALSDPEGHPVDITPFRRSALGAATARYEGIVLMRTGNYRVAAEGMDPSKPTYYRFHHDLRFPPIEGLRLRLVASDTRPVSVTAPRGGRVTVTIGPIAGSTVEPDIRAVNDPWGGRALDASQVLPGSPPPQLVRTNDGGVILSFVAPRPGRYTILAAARPGREGDAAVSTKVLAPEYGRKIVHPDSRDLDYGLPGEPSPRPVATPMPLPSPPTPPGTSGPPSGSAPSGPAAFPPPSPPPPPPPGGGFPPPGDPDGGTPGVAAR
jgi:hypothetical protein